MWKGGSDLQSDPPFPVGPVDPLQNDGRLIIAVKIRFSLRLSQKMIIIFGVELLGALLAPRWPQMQFGSPLEFHVEASWSISWRQDGPNETQNGQLGSIFGDI